MNRVALVRRSFFYFATDHAQEISVFNLDFPTTTSDVKFRAVQWICTEVLLALAALVNFLRRKRLNPLCGAAIRANCCA